MRQEKGGRKGSIKLWTLVCGIALAFLAYGLIMFWYIGDKGPPDWDFGVIEDTPGKSEFSTNSDQAGSSKPPEQQHVAEKPSGSEPPIKEKSE
jgi:flagellar basal body-associated protein FliL